MHLLRTLRWLILLPGLLLLSGCFQYDLTLRFDHQLHGQIVQTINLSDRAAAVANGTLAPWFHDLEARTRQSGGTVTETGYNQWSWVVPFTTSDDLMQRFDVLFADARPTVEASLQDQQLRESTQTLTLPGLGRIGFHLAIDQANWVFASRTHLTYDIDLQELPASPTVASAREGDRSWSTLRFRLQTPWGIGQVLPASAPPSRTLPNGAWWQLQPGRNYHIDVRFWVPSLVALGTVAIAVVVILGYFLRYRVFRPAPRRPLVDKISTNL